MFSSQSRTVGIKHQTIGRLIRCGSKNSDMSPDRNAILQNHDSTCIVVMCDPGTEWVGMKQRHQSITAYGRSQSPTARIQRSVLEARKINQKSVDNFNEGLTMNANTYLQELILWNCHQPQVTRSNANPQVYLLKPPTKNFFRTEHRTISLNFVNIIGSFAKGHLSSVVSSRFMFRRHLYFPVVSPQSGGKDGLITFIFRNFRSWCSRLSIYYKTLTEVDVTEILVNIKDYNFQPITSDSNSRQLRIKLTCN